ncbi:uncharacterized protein LOC144115381 isoform X1 [Amblyomma americanum]
MEHLRPPEPLRLTADGGRNWRLFRQKFEFFLQATACTDKPRSEAAKTALLLSVAGEDALDVFNNFVFTEGESKEDYATVIAKFEEYCVEQQNEIHERASPTEDGRSPGELLQGRRLRTPVPDFNPLPTVRVKKHRQISHNERALPRLSNNDVVRVNGKSWSRKAKVVGSAGPRAFHVHTEDNTILRRNRRHLLATKEQWSDHSSDDEDFGDNRASSQGVASTAPVAPPTPAEQSALQPLRRTTRQMRPPERLGYDQHFQQTSQRC